MDSTKRCDIPPEGGEVDYCLFGGIVRNVNMIIADEIYAENIFITTPESYVTATVKIKNASNEAREICAELIVLDNSSAVSEKRVIPAGECETFEIKTEIEDPKLWSPDFPYLYTAEIRVKKDGEMCVISRVNFGIRHFEFKSDGFFLNGELLKLRGVNRHEQWPWQGRAVPDKLQKRDADMIKTGGFNAVRCSHYPQSPAFLSRCDEIGLIVFEEAPGWQHVGDEAWQAVYMENIKEMILRDFNHPSIVTWGVRVNESWDNAALYKKTCALAKSLDPTRPTHGVRRNENYDTTEHIEDIFCANYQYPETPRFTPFVSTEHSWEHWTDGCGLPGASDAEAMAFTKSFADVMDYYYKNPLCCGGFAWSMFDYNNEVNYTKSGHVFYSGLYDIFRHKKSTSFLFLSQKSSSENAIIYISNYWTENSPENIEVYSNCDEVELFINGKSQGRKKPNFYVNIPHPAFLFKNVKFEPGELTAVGFLNGKEAARATRRTPEKAAYLALSPDYTKLVADGSDMTSITITLCDKNGTRLPFAENKVKIELHGDADFIGESEIALEGGRCAFMVKSRFNQPGKILCTASSAGVKSASCEIEILEYTGENDVPLP
ncbi:MAG: DUF4982 domain-containing protein [Clostridia bacterium]|nr:DUF4982 domain-containing protein [Clostridia bacterium]